MDKLSTKEQILRSGLRLLRTKSYNSFSFGDIAKQVGIKKSSVHYYFENKGILGVALVKYYHELIRSYIARFKPDMTAGEKLEAFVEFFKIGLEKKYLCPSGVLSVEFNTLPKQMQEELRYLFNYYLDWLSGICEEGLLSGEFSFDIDARTMAFHISTSIQGATAMARAYDTLELYNNNLNLILNQL